MKRINQQTLRERVAKDANVSQEVVRRVLESYQDVVLRALVAGETVTQSNFMSFTPVTRPERLARNLQTGELVVVPEQKAVKATVLPRVIELVRAGISEIDGHPVTTRKLPKGAKGIMPVVTTNPDTVKPRVRVTASARRRAARENAES